MKKTKKTKFQLSQEKRKMCLLLLANMNIRYIQGKPIKNCSSDLIFQEFQHRSGQSFNEYFKISTVLKNKKKEEGKIYLIGNIEYGLVKIGFSINPIARLKSIQTGCPFEVFLLDQFKGTPKKEKLLHRKYSQYNTNGEWFKYEGNLAEDFQIEERFEKAYKSEQ